MFKIHEITGNFFYINDECDNRLHSDGSIYRTVESWPTREQAQAVLDKYQPPHVWEHGDVFKSGGSIQIYLEPDNGPMTCVLGCAGLGGTPGIQLRDATFLFNIKDKL